MGKNKSKGKKTKQAPPPGRSAPLGLWLAIGAVLLLAGVGAKVLPILKKSSNASPPALKVQGYDIVAVYPHDPDAFTQGLIVSDGIFYEGTGGTGTSTLRKVDVKTGAVLQSVTLDPILFGEGITLWKDRLIQLTWRNQTGFVYDPKTLKRVDKFRYSGEGWGLTHDGTHLIMSDGTSRIRYLNPETFEVTGQIEVHDASGPVRDINELEYVGGEIYANWWRYDIILRISPENGRVLGQVDLSGLSRPDEGVLNGIAYDAKSGRLFVTGKNWSKLYEIKLKEPE